MQKNEQFLNEEMPSRFEQMRLDAENPASLFLHGKLNVNGHFFRETQGFSLCWLPMVPGNETNWEAKWLTEQFGLDPEKAWQFERLCFAGRCTRKMQPQTVSMRVWADSLPLPGEHLTAQKTGETFTLTHPLTGKVYKLTVEDLQDEELPQTAFLSDREYPTHCRSLTYSVLPEEGCKLFSLTDSQQSDQPRRKQEASSPYLPQATTDTTIGIIGGADGPTALFVGAPAKKTPAAHTQTVISSLSFAPRRKIEWVCLWQIFREEETKILLG